MQIWGTLYVEESTKHFDGNKCEILEKEDSSITRGESGKEIKYEPRKVAVGAAGLQVRDVIPVGVMLPMAWTGHLEPRNS